MIFLMVAMLCTTLLHATSKPSLVLLPIEVSKQDIKLSSEYGSALQEGLQNRYIVFYGAAVEKELEKEYKKIDCDAETCNQNIAIAFNVELIADSSVKSIKGGYLLKLVIRNVLTSEVIETQTIPCRGCDSFSLIERLKRMGTRTQKTSEIMAARGGSVVVRNASSERAILIFDTQPSGALITFNGKSVGTTPYQGLSHKMGDNLKFMLEHSSYRPYELELNLQQAITQLEPIVLEQGQGSLLIASKSFKAEAVIYVDGQAHGVAPKELMLSSGQHTIQIKTNNSSTKKQKIIIEDGQAGQLVLEFSVKPKAGKISSNSLGMKFVDIPEGSFYMGSNNGSRDEKPVHRAYLKGFKMMQTEVTWNHYQPCIDEGVCESDGDSGFGKANRPVINVSYDDIQTYIKWLKYKTGQTFRLPSEAQWEYAARAGRSTKYSWGNDINCAQAMFYVGRYSTCYYKLNGKLRGTLPVASFSSNSFGLYDMHGNVYEWTQDCWNKSYAGAPSNGRAWLTGDCRSRVLRGGSWVNTPGYLRSAYRYYEITTDRSSDNGFRLVKSL
ncbi:MAG: formylglycine-generating enzyme family protein [Colwellia sp.]